MPEPAQQVEADGDLVVVRMDYDTARTVAWCLSRLALSEPPMARLRDRIYTAAEEITARV